MKLIPHETEKTYNLVTERVYTFEVRGEHSEDAIKISKQSLAKLVADTYHVHPTKIRTLIRKGKPTRYSKGPHAYPGQTFRRDKHFVFVTLPENETISGFGQQETQEDKKAAKKAEKAAKKTDDKENK